MNKSALATKIGTGILKFALAGAIVLYLIHRNPREIFASFQNFDYKWLIPAFLCYALHWFCCSERWRYLARPLGFNLKCFEAFSISMQAAFFSLVIPGGTIGGDVIKMTAIARRAPQGTRVEGIFTVMIDRIIGMVALFSLALILLIVKFPLLMQISVPGWEISPPLLQLGIAGLALLCLAGIGAALAIFFHRLFEKIPGVLSVLNCLDRLTKGKINRLLAASDSYAQAWRKLLLAAILSCPFVHILCAMPLVILLWGVGVDFGIVNVIAASVIGNIIALIVPLPAGIGGRDVATITILAAGGIAAGDAKTAQLLLTGIILIFNLLGGVFFLLAPVPAAPQEEVK